VIDNPEDISTIPQNIIDLVRDNKYFGQMNDPSGSAYIKGACGDQMEFYIVVESSKITDIKFYTDGCIYTAACGAMACALTVEKSLQEALNVSAGQVISKLKVLPESHTHCAILAVSTLYKAIADYLLKP